MSDWKSRAQPADDWRARAEPADDAQAVDPMTNAVPPPGKQSGPEGWEPAGTKHGGLGDLKQLERDQNKQYTNMWGAIASGAHGVANAMEGPINGAIAALKKSVPMPGDQHPPTWDEIVKSYTDERDRVQGGMKQNLKDFPRAPMVGALMAGGVGFAPTSLGRIGLSGVQGALYGTGSSEHNLTGANADPSGVAEDAKTGGIIGFGAGALGEAAQLPGRYLAGKAQTLSNATHAATHEAESEARAGAMRSAIGSHGGDVSAGSGQLKMLRDALTDPNADPELVKRAQAFLASDEGKALANRVLNSNIGRAEGQLGRIQTSQTAMQEAIAKNDPALIRQAAEAMAEAKLNDPSGVTKRLAELARRNIPPAAGAMIGGAPGAAAGALIGGAMGRPGTIISNALKSPSMFRPLITGASTGIGAGNAMSHAVPPLAEWARFLKPDDKEPQ